MGKTVNFRGIITLLFLAACNANTAPPSGSSKNALLYETIKIKVGKAPGSVEAADLNNDKLPDLIVASEQDSNVTILLNKGKGKFEPAVNSPFSAGNGVNDIATGDFNRDGNIDLAFANHERKYITVLLGNGKGSFTAAAGSPFPADVLPHTHGVAAGDFNNDGRPDLVADSWGNNQVEVLFADSLTGFKTPGTFFKVGKHPYQRVRVADLDNDGNIDIITSNLEGDNVTVLLGNGKGNFNEAPGSPFPCGDSPFGLAAGDVNGDGIPDLAVINSPASTADRTGKNGLTILTGNRDGKFTTMKGSPFEAGKIPNRIAIADVNADGVNDIVTSDSETDKIYLFLMNKTGEAITGSPIIVGSHPKGIAIADLNGDGKADIVVCNNGDDEVWVLGSK